MTALRWGARLLATLSLTILVWHSFQLGLAAPLPHALGWYEAQILGLSGLVQPFANAVLHDLSGRLGWNAQLYPYWPHVFLLLWLTLGLETDNELYGRPNSALGILTTIGFEILALAGAFVGAVFTGVLSPDPHHYSQALVLEGAMVPIAGVVFYFLARQMPLLIKEPGLFWAMLAGGVAPMLIFSAAVLLFEDYLLASAKFRLAGNPSIVMLITFLGAFGLYMHATSSAFGALAAEKKKWPHVRNETGYGILSVFGGVALLLLLNTGLRQAGM